MQHAQNTGKQGSLQVLTQVKFSNETFENLLELEKLEAFSGLCNATILHFVFAYLSALLAVLSSEVHASQSHYLWISICILHRNFLKTFHSQPIPLQRLMYLDVWPCSRLTEVQTEHQVGENVVEVPL